MLKRTGKRQTITMRTPASLFLSICLVLASVTRAQAEMGTTVAISSELATGIAEELFPVTMILSEGNLFLTAPGVEFINSERIAINVRFQAYDHRPEKNIAISETGRARVSGTLGFDKERRQILLYNPTLDAVEFDHKSEVTQRLLAILRADWSAQLVNPIRSDIPPHPYLLAFRKNIADLSYDGKSINVKMLYE